MATTLAQFWQAERDVNAAAQSAAQKNLAAAQTALVSANAMLDSSVTALNKIGSDIAANRAKLATTSVPSELTALNNILRDQLNTQRALQGTTLDGQDAVSSAQADVNAADGALKRTTQRLADSNASLDAANISSTKRQTLKTQLAAAPFITLQADATTATASSAATDAKAEIDTSIPTALQAIATKRYATRTARATQLAKSAADAQNALGKALAKNNGLGGTAAQKGIAFEQADAALRDYAARAKQRLDRAVAVLANLQALKNGTKTPDLLTPQEKLDVKASAERTTAETKIESLDAARMAVYSASNDFDAQILTQIDTDVDALATDATVKAKRDAIDTKDAALTGAENALVASGDRKIMDNWQIVVQDSAWSAFIDYLDATAALAELKSIAPASLSTACDAAEDAYAVALAAASKAQRQADALTDTIAIRTARVDASTASMNGRLLSAVRGDSF